MTPVGLGSPMEAVSLDGSRKSPSFGSPGDVHSLPHLKQIRSYLLPELIPARIIHRELLQMSKSFSAAFLEMPLLRPVHFGLLFWAKPYLYGIVAVNGHSLDLGNDTRTRLDDGNRYHRSLGSKKARHPQLLSQHTFTHIVIPVFRVARNRRRLFESLKFDLHIHTGR